MPHIKTLLITAALIAAPSLAFAQISTDAATSAAKEKAVDSVLKNATGDDAIVAGKSLLNGGSKTDAAVAVVKNRANDKIETMTDGVRLEEVSKDGVIDAGKEIAVNKAQGSATKYTDGVTGSLPSVGGVSTDGAVNAARGVVGDKAAGSVTTYSDEAKTYGNSFGLTGNEKAKSLLSTGSEAVIPKSGIPTTTVTTPGVTLPPINCPIGTKDAGNGTCMVTGDWKP